MSIKIARHYLLYAKDLVQSALFIAVVNARRFSALNPLLAFVFRPLLALTLGSLALTQAWSFWSLHHKNIDGWLNTFSSLAGGVLNNISAFGSLIARLQGLSFAAAPWLLVAGFGIGAVNQLTLAAINGRRAFESPDKSIARTHYLQSTVYNLVLATQLITCVTGIVVFNLAPGYSLVAGALASAVVLFNAGTSIWRFLASETKKRIKNGVGYGKPDEIQATKEHLSTNTNTSDPISTHSLRLFTTCNHRLVIKGMDASEQKKYLSSCLEKKLAELSKQKDSDKKRHKMEVLKILSDVVTANHPMPNLGKLHQKHPHCGDNFWCEKSETQQLIDAVDFYYHEQLKTTPYRCSL